MPQSQQREQRRELSDAASGELTHEAGATRRPLSKNSLWRQMRAGIAVGGTLAGKRCLRERRAAIQRASCDNDPSDY